MAGRVPFKRAVAFRRHRPAVPLLMLLLPALACAAPAAPTTRQDAGAPSAPELGSDSGAGSDTLAADRAPEGAYRRPRPYGPPGRMPGIPSDDELEAAGAVIGEIIIDNQNIFDLSDPKDDTKLFRLANKLHARTRPNVIRRQLLFKSGQLYSHKQVEESERILRGNNYFYDAWIRVVSYHDGKVDVRVTTRDVWTLNPGINVSRTGGENAYGVQLEEVNLAGTGTDLKVSHSKNVDRTSNEVGVRNSHAFGSWVAYDLNLGNLSDGHLRELTVQQPFYSLESRWATGGYGIDDLQTDSLYDRGEIIDKFADKHQGAQLFYGWSTGLKNGWVQRLTTGVTYDEHQFAPVSSWTGVTVLPEDRRFIYPWVQYDLIQDDYLKLVNHDQIARTEDFYVGTSASLRAGWADTAYGSSSSALIFQGSASKGFARGASTLLLATDFSGRMHNGEVDNGILDGSIRYYVEQSKNWLFFTTLVGTKGRNLDLDNQILLGGDNGLRGYPLRYQSGTARALITLEQRYFTDWYPFRLFRVGGAIFFDAGRTWGQAPLAQPSLGLLTDAGFGLRLGNSRSALGNVVHVDLAFPFNGDPTIKRVQFLIQTEQRF
jgi:surface antigen-like variable number repeat protein